ncbi:MAG: multicopper oxidase domain-containing protein [Steroidobacteraceae bacterium]
MLDYKRCSSPNGARTRRIALCMQLIVALLYAPTVFSADVAVTVTTARAAGQTNNFSGSLRWTLEEDVTWPTDPANPPANLYDSPTLKLHKSYMPVARTGSSASPSFTITGLDASKRYYLSILPDRPAGSTCTTAPPAVAAATCFTMTGGPVIFATPAATTTTTRIVVNPQPLPPAQLRIFAFEDVAPINNTWDVGEVGLGGFTVFIYDMGGQLNTDTFGNPLGTEYVPGTLDGDAAPTVARLGDGTLHTMTAAEVADPTRNPYHLKVGELLVRNIAPGKYGVRIVPPTGSGYQQTTTIEGTKGIDAWVRAGEPILTSNLVEFGPTFAHTFFGFVRQFNRLGATPPGQTAGSIRGVVSNLRMARAPDPNFYDGQPAPNCWVGLNGLTSGLGLYAAPCAEGDNNSAFSIPNVPPGDYQLVVWDKYLDLIIGFFSVSVTNGQAVDLGQVSVPFWFHAQQHYVFRDSNDNGIWEPALGETGIPDQIINFRFRDGSIFQTSTTDTTGYLPFDEVFPFFSWLIAEVDYSRFKATGMTVAIDDGGEVSPTSPFGTTPDIGAGILNPQIQDPADGGTNCGGGGCKTRTEATTAPVLLEGFNGFAGNTNIFTWGKRAYGAGENGGIAGIVYYQVTRAENDPRFAAAETWEPGIPRVQTNLYRADATGVIQDANNIAGIQLADIDNAPLGWSDGGARGPEDVKRCLAAGCAAAAAFDRGDAIAVVHTDSFDDSPPEGCVGDTLSQQGLLPAGACYDALHNWAQVRPAVFDGGYAFGAPFTTQALTPGVYVVEANAPPGYKYQDEASKNVDFGDTFVPQALPPVCVGDPAHTGGTQQANHYAPGAELSLFPGVPMDEAYLGDRPVCNFKQVVVADGKNAAADFFMYTDVPVSGHIQGLTTNDLGNEPNPNSPNFGEKLAAAHIPISIRDFAGNEINRIYTDEWGHYNGLVPSSYRISVPMPSGVSPEMAQVCLNPSTKPDPANPGSSIADPFFDPRYSQTCYVFNFTAGKTTYLDTPVLPVAGFVSTPSWQLDCAYPTGTPVIRAASINAAAAGTFGTGTGPYIASGGSRVLTLWSVGDAQVPDPINQRPALVTRNFGFGATAGTVYLNGAAIPAANISVWAADRIVVTIPATAPFNATGQVEVVRGDNGVRTVNGVTLIQGAVGTVVTNVVAGGSIQAAIDATPAGGVVLVGPGLYYEGIIITKPLQLQGWGAAGTIVNAARSGNFAEFNSWRERAHQRANCPLADVTQRIGLLPGQPNNVGPGTDACSYLPGTGLFATEEHAAVIVAPRAGVFGAAAARIDGFTFTGAEFSGGLIVNGYTSGLEISNNIIANNQGQAAGGIRVGHPTILDGNGELVNAQNRSINIHHNHVMENGSTFDHGGGIGLYNGSDNYRVSANYVCGNFSQGDGGGIAHYGRSPGGVIERNRILFNQSFDQTATGQGGTAGGLLIAGHEQPVGAAVALSAGTGSVQVNANLIQGNQAGSGDGGGIALRYVNGQDVLASTNSATWNTVDILNNMIVNNVTGLAGGGIGVQDALRVAIVNNTIVNNDSAATAAAAFGADPNVSLGQPAGVVARAHSPALAGRPGVGNFSNPTLQNNIILGNRKQHWEAGIGLIVDGVHDLGVLGNNGTLNPQRNILSNDPINAGYNANNPRVAVTGEDALLVTPYFNGPTGALGGGTFNSPLLAAGANDEGGNFLTVIHGPLSPVGNYHLEAGSSAIDPVLGGGGTNGILGSYPALLSDYDGASRPVDGTTAGPGSIIADLGADEAPVVVAATAAPPQILSTPPNTALILTDYVGIGFTGVPYVYQVVAVDPNGTAVTYTVTRVNLLGIPLATPPGLAISAGGLLTFTPSTADTFRLRVRASSGGQNADQFITLVVTAPTAAPVANNDSFAVNRNGTFSVAAPGVISNDTVSPLYGALTAELLSNLATGGGVTLAPDGAVSYVPQPTFVGTTSFTYRVSATRLLSGTVGTSNTATVTLNRELAATSMQYIPAATGGGGEWRFAGLGSVNGRTLSFRLDRTGTNLPGTATVAGNAWSYSTTAGPAWQLGDTVTITATGGGPVAFTLGLVPVGSAGGNVPRLSTDFVQCPGDTNGDAIIDTPDPAHPRAVCKHLAAGDGFIKMADGATDLYTFGFNDVTGQASGHAIEKGILNAQFPAPTLVFNEGDEVYLTLTNAGMLMRPDLFDPHSVHFHGFPNAGSVFDGVPESSVTINMGFSFTYYYSIRDPGTYMYHCHVEASEHMQMGMLGNLYVRPAQDGTLLGGFNRFVYNDGDGSTGYDIEVPIQIGSMDSNFHVQHIGVQPLPFADMHDDFPMLNGRGYPDTVSASALAAPADKVASGVTSANESSQTMDSRIVATAGQRILLRISNLNVTRFYTLATTGLPMRVVGTGAHILRGPGGASASLYYETASVTLGGGEAVDVLIDTTGVAPGTYLLYSTNLEALSNGAEDFGGMMTEIVIN